MNKSSVFIILLLLSFNFLTVYSQQNNGQSIPTNEQQSDIFYHTIERGQTVYAIATMYGVGVDDIYRLNPESKTGIRAGAVLKVPQRDAAVAPAQNTGEEYTYHTIQPKETLYSLSVRYNVRAQDLITANPGLSVQTFTIGKNIRIPATQIESLPTTEIQTVTKEIDYTIKRRETMYSICRQFNVSSAELIKRNPKLRKGLKAGMTIQIPVKTEEAVTQQVEIPKEKEVNALLSQPKKAERVDRIKVALLLPFMTDEVAQSSHTARFVEYYEGMLMAVDSLRKQGGSLELSVFDTGNGTDKINDILKEEALLEANLIIGAVQNEQIAIVARFAQEHQIKYVIPLTSRNDDVLSNANVFQVNTPHSYLYSNAAQAGCSLFANDNIILLNMPADKEDKPDFIKAFKAEIQTRHITIKELNYEPTTFARDIEQLLVHDKRNIVLPSTASLDALTKIKMPLRMLSEVNVEFTEPYTISLFGYPEWQTYTRECLEDFHALNTYIYSNFYADNLSPQVQNFYTAYKDWYSKNLINTFPKYGILGFDTGMFFFNAIRKYGTNFENKLDEVKYKSLQTGFNFERVNNWGGFINTNVFIVHYNNDYTVTRTDIR